MAKSQATEQTKLIREQFGRHLRAALDDAGMTPADLSRATMLTPGTIGDYLSGRSAPSIVNLILIARAVKQSVSWLVGDSLHGRDTLEYHQKELALRLGGERLRALADVEDDELWAMIDLLIKGSESPSVTKPAQRNSKRRASKRSK